MSSPFLYLRSPEITLILLGIVRLNLLAITAVHTRFLCVGFLILGLCCGCFSEQEQSPAAQQADSVQVTLPDFSSVSTSDVYVYECSYSKVLKLTAHVTQDSTWLFLPDTSLKVMPVQSGSGARYEGNSYIYWSKENEALLQKPTGPLMRCESVPQERSWQAAKLRGVDFRALGQEPGWILEITKGEQIIYSGNYGQDTVRTAVPDPEKEKGKITYHTETDSDTLTLEILDEPCTDVMSGFKFPKTVSVSVNGETFRGCGRWLDESLQDHSSPEK